MSFDVGAFLGDLGGSIVSGMFGSNEASKNRRFQRKMSNTAYQRAANDLEAAGLNRILALGSPASTPSGDSASIAAPALGSNAVAAASAKQAIKQSKAQEDLLNEQARIAGAEADQAEVMKKVFDVIEPLVNEAGDALQEWLSSGAKGDLPQTVQKLVESGVTSAKSAVSSAVSSSTESVARNVTSARDKASMAIGDMVDSLLYWLDKVNPPQHRQFKWRDDLVDKKEKRK